MALHAEKGIIATSAEDVARRADVAVATVYRHFPRLDDLVSACGLAVYQHTQPPDPSRATEIFGSATSVEARLEVLINELFAFYERGAPWLTTSLGERHLYPLVAQSVQQRHAAREALVREALSPLAANEGAVRVVSALTDFPVWKSLSDRGIAKEMIAAAVKDLVVCWLSEPRPAGRV